MTAREIIDIYISFFEKRGHKRIPGAPLVPLNDPTTLFTSSGMQPLVPYLLGETHPAGTRLVDVQNSFRAVDIEEVGDNRHTTFFRMLGNWSLGDYFKSEQLPWIWEFLIQELRLDPKRLYVTVFEGSDEVPRDDTSVALWTQLFTAQGMDPKERIFFYGAEKNWWSRSGTPDKMPPGEPGGPDSEIFYDFGAELKIHEQSPWKDEKCHVNCDCGRFVEICNSVFMQYIKNEDGSLAELPKPNVDFGGGLERLLIAVENQPDVFRTNLFWPIIEILESQTQKSYSGNEVNMRIVTDHFTAATFLTMNGVIPSNKDQGYIVRRLIRRGLDHLWELNKHSEIKPLLEVIVEQYKATDPELVEKFEHILLTIETEKQGYENTLANAKKLIEKDLKSLGYTFDNEALAEKIKEHKNLSRTASAGKFKGGLADTQDLTVKGHTATHLLQQALRDVLGNHVSQTGSNITIERLRFDFSHPDKLTEEQIHKVEEIVREKIKENLAVHFEMLPLQEAKDTGAIGLFDEKYEQKVKVYFIGGSGQEGDHDAYSKEFCGGPHVPHTNVIQSFEITKQESIGKGQQRIYAVVS